MNNRNRKLSYHPGLYLGEGINQTKLDKIKKRLEKKPILAGVYLITLSPNPSDQLEIYDARQLVQSYYQTNPPYIIGIAQDYEDALKLLERLAKECLLARGDCSLKEYLLC